MVKLFEKKNAPKVVHARTENEVFYIKYTDNGVTKESVKIRNAFDILMDSGGGSMEKHRERKKKT